MRTAAIFFGARPLAMDPSLENVRGLWRRLQADLAAPDTATTAE